MPKSCINCSAAASPGLKLQSCAQCQTALYCSKACQREDWKKKKHKQICKLLNVGHGDMQVWTEDHTSKQIWLKDVFEEDQRDIDEEMKRFFKLFQKSTQDGSRAAALEMKEIARRQTKHQKGLFFHGLRLLIRSNSEMLSWPTSPLLVLLQFLDPSVLSGDEDTPLQEGETSATPLHFLATLASPSDYSTHQNQLILAKQLIKHDADVNAVSIPRGTKPLHTHAAGPT
jgi:hypothetical protein